jgi:hypothetical protein
VSRCTVVTTIVVEAEAEADRTIVSGRNKLHTDSRRGRVMRKFPRGNGQEKEL